MTELEHAIIAAVRQLSPNASGFTIIRAVKESTGRSISIGRLYVTLEHLESLGLIRSWRGEATQERGWRPKRLYTVN